MSIPAIELMTALRSGHATSPRLTWYGPDSERVELSGRVLDNWVAKTSNLLQDELDAEPGMRLRLDLPAHWKSMIWALAAWQLGMETVFDGGEAELLATADPAPDRRRERSTPSSPWRCRRWPCGGRASCLPESSTTPPRSAPTATFLWRTWTRQRPAAPCGPPTGRHTPTADLMDGFAAPHDEGVRLLVPAADGLEAALAHSLGAWNSGGSVVLVHPEVELTDKLLAAERINGS